MYLSLWLCKRYWCHELGMERETLRPNVSLEPLRKSPLQATVGSVCTASLASHREIASTYSQYADRGIQLAKGALPSG